MAINKELLIFSIVLALIGGVFLGVGIFQQKREQEELNNKGIDKTAPLRMSGGVGIVLLIIAVLLITKQFF